MNHWPKVPQIAVAEPEVTEASLTPKPSLFVTPDFDHRTGAIDAGWGPGTQAPFGTLSPQDNAF